MPLPASTILKTTSLTVGYDTPLCLFPDVELATGLVQISAPNGLGKSTLFDTLAGLRSPLGGKATLGDQSELCYLSHQLGFDDQELVADVTGLWAQNTGSTAEQVQSGLTELALTALQYSPVKELSAGQRKRLALLRVWLSKAQLLLLDEPFVGLDRQWSEWLLQWLAKVSRTKLIMVVAHDRVLPNSQVIQLGVAP